MIKRIGKSHLASATPILVLLAIVSVGCDTNVAYVNGTTLYEGSPIPEGTRVIFQHPASGYAAVGIVKADGSFELMHKGEKKIEPGDYKIFVGPPESNMSEKEFYALKTKVDAEFKARGKKPPPSPDWVLPTEYYQSNTSPLRQTIEPGENLVNVELSE